MAEKIRELRKTIVAELLRRAAAAWERYREALRGGEVSVMRDEYEAFIRLLRPVYKHGFKQEVEYFLKNTAGVPVRAVLKRLSE